MLSNLMWYDILMCVWSEKGFIAIKHDNESIYLSQKFIESAKLQNASYPTLDKYIAEENLHFLSII